MHLIKSFSQDREGGNPAGVCLDANALTDGQILTITQDLGFGESAFLQSSSEADFKIRLFSVVGEVKSCVTATIAAASLIEKDIVVFETAAGIREVYKKPDGLLLMKQPPVQFFEAAIDREHVAGLLNISPDRLMEYPLEIGSVGTPKLLIPVKSLNDLFAIKPNLAEIARYCETIGARGFYPFTLETKNPNADFHARQFNPQDNIAEDPVTGVAAAALTAYFIKHSILSKHRIIGEQGHIIDKPGEIIIEINDGTIFVGGYATRYDTKILEV